MKIEKIIKAIFAILLLSSVVVAGVAISGARTFTQPDGTKFEGVLKGDASFHWIESSGNIVIYNPKDKFYYKAVIDEKKGLILTNEKPDIKANKISASSSRVAKEHKVTQDDRKKLYIMYKKSKTGNYPK